MFHTKSRRTTSKQALNHFIFLALLLPSFHVFAADPATALNESTQATKSRVIPSHKTDRPSTPVYRKSINSKTTVTRRVTMDNYERVMRTVSQPRSTQTVWLGKSNRSDNRQKPKTTWLGKKGKSD
jgi:hypothetical protein